MRMVFILFFTLLSAQLIAQNNRLTVHVSALKNHRGQVIIDIFDNDTGYPMKTENAILRKKITIPADGNVVFHIDDLEDGEYAFALIHDENKNDKLDVNFIGIPKEGAGASNNAKGLMSPPGYEDARFSFNKSTEMTIKMLYF